MKEGRKVEVVEVVEVVKVGRYVMEKWKRLCQNP